MRRTQIFDSAKHKKVKKIWHKIGEKILHTTFAVRVLTRFL